MWKEPSAGVSLADQSSETRLPKPAVVDTVEPGSIGEELGFQPGDKLLSINGVRPRDLIDLQWLVGVEELRLEVEDPDGTLHEVELEKEADEGLGLGFSEALFDGLRQCNNHCAFCFIDAFHIDNALGCCQIFVEGECKILRWEKIVARHLWPRENGYCICEFRLRKLLAEFLYGLVQHVDLGNGCIIHVCENCRRYRAHMGSKCLYARGTPGQHIVKECDVLVYESSLALALHIIKQRTSKSALGN